MDKHIRYTPGDMEVDKFITEIIPDFEKMPDWMREAFEAGQFFNACRAKVDELEARVHEVYEAYANMEGFPIVTDNEKYLMRVIEIMRDEAKPPDKE